MFKKKNKKSKILQDEIVVSNETNDNIEETLDLQDEVAITENDDFTIENDEETKGVNETTEDEFINLESNGRKSYIEEADLKFKEVIDDIEIDEEPTTNFINIDDANNEIIEIKDEDNVFVDEHNSEDNNNDLIVNTEEDTTEETAIVDDELIPSEANEEVVEKKSDKELKTYFKASKKQNKKLLVKKPKQKRIKKTSKRKLRQKQIYDDIQNQRIFRFRGKKYSKVEDFIAYLNDNYLDIDNIAKEVLDDKAFYGFIAKKSGVFDTSIKEFKRIKEEIDN